MRIAAYCRVSTAEQGSEGVSLAAQAAAIDAAAAARGWQVVARFQDIGSGKSMARRPGIAAAIEAVESGHADAIVASRLDRLSRSVVDAASLMERAKKREWHLCALDVGLDSSTPAGGLVWHVLAAVASWERAAIAERTRLALAEKRAAGVVLGRPRQMTSESIQRIHELRADDLTLAEIAQRLNTEGVPTPTGHGAWHPPGVARALRFAEAA